MLVRTSPQNIYDIVSPSVFLAGGITDCPEWQNEIIKHLDLFHFGTLFNPRRKDFDITIKDAAKKQVTWEFNALEVCNIFSIWFSDGKSVQPICMYELGRNVTRFAEHQKLDRVLIGVDPKYKRKEDVYIQMELLGIVNPIVCSLEAHAKQIKQTVIGIYERSILYVKE